YRVRALGDFTHIRPDAPQIVALFKAMKQRGTILDATLLPFLQEAEHDAGKQIGAAAMGQSAQRGTITPGKRADLVVLKADPTHDIGNTRKIDFVVKNGRIYRKNGG